MRLVILVGLLFLLFSCSDRPQDIQKILKKSATVFGADDRVGYDYEPDTGLFNISHSELLKIVRVTMGTQHCTGALVGKDLVLTAAHCFEGLIEDGKLNQTIWVYVKYRNGKYAKSTYVKSLEYGSMNPTYRATDWAILKISDPLGDTYGYFDVEAEMTVDNSENGDVTLAGFSTNYEGGNVLSVHSSCQVRHYDFWGMLNHDCDMTYGASGGPLLSCKNKKCKIIGVNVGFKIGEDEVISESQAIYTFEYANYGVNPNRFIQKLNEMK